MASANLKQTAEPWFQSIYGQANFLEGAHKSDLKNGKKKDRKNVSQILAKFAYYSFVDSLSSNLSSYSNSSKSTHLTSSESHPNMSIFRGTEMAQFQADFLQNENNSLENPIFELDQSKPVFIQQFSKLNSVLPNYHHQFFSMPQQIQKLSKLLQAAHKAFNTVKFHAEKLATKQKIFNEVKNIGLKFVNKTGCETCKEKKYYNELKPRSNFNLEVLSLEYLRQKLELIESRIMRYQIILSLTSKIDLSLYLRIRQVLLQVQQQLIKCSASIYMAELKENDYPNFCYAYVELLKNQDYTKN